MSIMFANTRMPGTGSGHLLEFKAGRTIIEPGSTPDKRKCVADKTKGLVYIKQSNDQLMHFCWRNRDKNADELDLIIFPGDTEFVRIKECADGRVYMLKFKSSDDHKLFWMQESRTDKDDEYCKKVNDLLNNPPSSRARGGGAERAANNTLAAINQAIGGSDEIGALGNMDQNQIMQLFSLMNGGANAADFIPQLGINPARAESPATAGETPKIRKERAESSGGGGGVPAKPTGSNKFDTQMLSSIISKLPTPSKRNIELSKVLTRANVGEIVKANAEKLAPHLPTTSEEQEIAHTIGSPQFQQGADFFSAALNSGQLGAALRHFNLDESVIKAADKGDLLHFCEALTKSQRDNKELDAQINKEAEQEENNESKKDDGMDLD